MTQDRPGVVPFDRGRTIILKHHEFADHQEVTAQWLEKHYEDNGDVWQGSGQTLREACINAIDSMFENF